MRRTLVLFGLLASSWGVSSACAQLPTGWKAHDWDRERPKIVTPGESNLPLAPPSDAVVLFNGKDLSNWRDQNGGPAKWVIKDEVMESVPDSGYIFTAQSFGDCQLHVEWSSPAKVEGKSQGRGNSGVFLMGLYEVQVLDSFDNITYADGQAGSLYGQYPPLVNASRGPGQWQSYDIVFRRPRFDESGGLVSQARLTVFHNGVLIQDNVTAFGPTAWLQHLPTEKHADKLPLSFQDHGNPVRFRNVWIRELDESDPAKPARPYATATVKLSAEQMKRLEGKYGMWEVATEGEQLWLKAFGRKLELMPVSETECILRLTAGKVTFVTEGMKNPKLWTSIWVAMSCTPIVSSVGSWLDFDCLSSQIFTFRKWHWFECRKQDHPAA